MQNNEITYMTNSYATYVIKKGIDRLLWIYEQAIAVDPENKAAYDIMLNEARDNLLKTFNKNKH